VLGEVEREMKAELGNARFEALHDALLALLPLVEMRVQQVEGESEHVESVGARGKVAAKARNVPPQARSSQKRAPSKRRAAGRR
jgi:hypothetical protein